MPNAVTSARGTHPAKADVSLGGAAPLREQPPMGGAPEPPPRALLGGDVRKVPLQAPKVTLPPRAVLDRPTHIQKDGPGEAYVDGDQLFAAHVRLYLSILSAEDAKGMTRVATRGDLTDVIMPDGTEVARGSARITVITDGKAIKGILDDVSFGPETTFVRRGVMTMKMPGGGTAITNKGGLLVQGEAAIGITPHSDATFEGLRVTSADKEVKVTFSPPDRYSVSGDGATIIATPKGRVTISGNNLALRTKNVSYDVDGTVLVSHDGGKVESKLGNPPPASEQLADFSVGKIGLLRVPKGQLFVDGVSDRDFDQLRLPNCWFVATVLAIAAMRPKMIEDMFTDNHDHTYTVRLFRNGQATHVTVDDHFYQYAGFYKQPAMVYAASRDPLELWGPLLEKADAALNPEGYQGIHAGWPDIAFKELTGLDSDDTNNRSVSDDKLFEQITRNALAHIPMVAESNRPYKDQAEKERLDHTMLDTWGLHNQHAFAVIDTRIEDGQRYIIMRNTYRYEFKFKGNGYDGDVDVDGDGKPDGEDGYFRIRIEDYRQVFDTTTTLRLAD